MNTIGRRKNKNVKTVLTHKEYRKKSILRDGTKVYNTITPKIKNTINVNKFKYSFRKTVIGNIIYFRF